MDKIRTTVIVPVYNTEPYITDCLDSLLRQTQKELQVVVVDDGSTDRSMQIVEGYRAHFENMLILRQENQGLGAARNAGVRAAAGQYIYFLDSDDFIETDTLETCYQCAKENSLDLVLFDAATLLEDGVEKGIQIGKYDRRAIIKDFNRKYTGREFLESYMKREPDIVSACLMYTKRSFVEEHHLQFQEGITHEDEEYRFRLMMADPKVMYLPKLFYNRRYRAGSIMTAPIEQKRLCDYIFSVEQMIVAADGRDTLAMSYIARKIWPAFVRYNKLKQKEAEREIREKLYIMLRNYHDRFYCITKDTEHILYEYQLQRILMKKSKSEQDNVAAERARLLHTILAKLPLGEAGRSVGIYGLGSHTEKLLREYRKVVGAIQADMIFIDSNKETGAVTFMGNTVYNVADLSSLPMQEIVISSYLYEVDMAEKLQSLYGDKYKVIRLYEEYPFVLLDFIEESC